MIYTWQQLLDLPEDERLRLVASMTPAERKEVRMSSAKVAHHAEVVCGHDVRQHPTAIAQRHLSMLNLLKMYGVHREPYVGQEGEAQYRYDKRYVLPYLRRQATGPAKQQSGNV